MLRIALVMMAASLALTAFNLRGMLPDVPVAEQSPADCDPAMTRTTSSIHAPGASAPPYRQGEVLTFRVGAALPIDPLGVACDLGRIDVYAKLPGDRSFRLVCRVATLSEGEAMMCPQRLDYRVDFAHAVDSALVAHVRVIGDVLHDEFECTVPSHKRDPRRTSNCVDATGLTVLGPVLP